MKEMTDIIINAAAADDPSLVERRSVLSTEAPKGGWATATPAPPTRSPKPPAENTPEARSRYGS
jgi:hypothetical protein